MIIFPFSLVICKIIFDNYCFTKKKYANGPRAPVSGVYCPLHNYRIHFVCLYSLHLGFLEDKLLNIYMYVWRNEHYENSNVIEVYTRSMETIYNLYLVHTGSLGYFLHEISSIIKVRHLKIWRLCKKNYFVKIIFLR